MDMRQHAHQPRGLSPELLSSNNVAALHIKKHKRLKHIAEDLFHHPNQHLSSLP